MTASMEAGALYRALEEEFKPALCTEVFPVIGLQHHNADRVNKVWTATFAGEEVFARLEKENASDCMLFTHHPVPQRDDPAQPPPPIPPERLRFMEEHRITLFCYHIPLDRNGPYAPGMNLAKAIGAAVTGEFYEQNLVKMGVLCDTRFASQEDVAAALEGAVGHAVKLYPHAEGLLGGRIAIMAGGARSTAIYEGLREKGVTLFLTGTTNPNIPWVAEIHKAAQAAGVSILGGTHYSTERFAPMAMTRFFGQLGIDSEFIPETPHLQEL